MFVCLSQRRIVALEKENVSLRQILDGQKDREDREIEYTNFLKERDDEIAAYVHLFCMAGLVFASVADTRVSGGATAFTRRSSARTRTLTRSCCDSATNTRSARLPRMLLFLHISLVETARC